MRMTLLGLALFFAACGDGTKNENVTSEVLEAAGELTASTPDTLCYYRTEGTTNQDTALVQLILNGDEVIGRMMNLPHETDSRVGRLKGTIKGDYINAQWVYIAEGMIDSVDVSFQMRKDGLLQKPNSFDPETGREFLSDTASYNLEFTPTACDISPLFTYDLTKMGL